MSVLQELAVEHPYHCSESNYYSNDASHEYACMTDFLDDFEGSDVDMNLCFRWDIKARKNPHTGEPVGGYDAEVFLMLQRKGIFKPCTISSVSEDEAVRFKAYALKHLETIKAIWSPML